MRILFDSKNSTFKEPFGTIEPFSECRITVHIPNDCGARSCSLIIEKENGCDYARFTMGKDGGEGDYEFFTCRFALAEAGLYYYKFRIDTADGQFSLYKQGYDQTNMESGDMWQLSCIPKDFVTPDHLSGSVMYQIFPDRFRREGTCDLSGKLEPYFIHDSISDIPCYRPDENGEVKNCDFFGGNLRGIEAGLDYLHGLGVDIIYLNPIFKAWSNHRYDTCDYMKVDEMLGNEDDFRSLCKAAHSRGMKIILDGVFSHTGSRSIYFDAAGEFGNGAYDDPCSPYRQWYEFVQYPDKYTCWWGVPTLPCVDERNPDYEAFIVGGEDSVIAHWLRAGADGFRLDVADELPDEFISKIRKRMKEIDPDSLLIGEVWEDASNKVSYGVRRSYFTAGELDSVMNYPFRNAIIDYVSGRDRGPGFVNTVMSVAENYPPQVLGLLMNMLSTHDTPRILSLLSPGEPPADRNERAGWTMSGPDRKTAEKRLTAAGFIQFMLPGMPCIFYGDEIGTEGYEDPFCRSFFDWSRTEENPILEFVRDLSAHRHGEPALQRGRVKATSDGEGRVFIERELDGTRLVATVNTGDSFRGELNGKVLICRGALISGSSVEVEKYGFVLEKVS